MVEVKTNCCRKRGCSLRQQNICSDNLSCSRSREHQTTFASINLLEIMMHLDHQRRPFKNCKTYDFSDRRVNIILNIMLTLLWKGETASNIDTCPFSIVLVCTILHHVGAANVQWIINYSQSFSSTLMLHRLHKVCHNPSMEIQHTGIYILKLICDASHHVAINGCWIINLLQSVKSVATWHRALAGQVPPMLPANLSTG